MKNPLFKIALVAVIGFLATVTVVAGTIFWKFKTYHSLRHFFESQSDSDSLALVTRYSNNRFFNPNWTIANSLRWIPFGWKLYNATTPCISCQGDFHSLLYYAVKNNLLKTAQFLIQNGSSIEHHDDKGADLLAAAVFSGDKETIRFVSDHGAVINAPFGLGECSALHLSAIQRDNYSNLISELLSCGADINLPDSRGWTPLDWAATSNLKAIPFITANGGRSGTNKTRNLERSARRVLIEHGKLTDTLPNKKGPPDRNLIGTWDVVSSSGPEGDIHPKDVPDRWISFSSNGTFRMYLPIRKPHNMEDQIDAGFFRTSTSQPYSTIDFITDLTSNPTNIPVEAIYEIRNSVLTIWSELRKPRPTTTNSANLITIVASKRIDPSNPTKQRSVP